MSENTANIKTAVFGGGCFWCTEAAFKMIKGVIRVDPGYAGGAIANPSYEAVSNGNTGHAEVIKITYDASIVSYNDLLTVFFYAHDPTTLNRQGNDIGTQYRSVIFYVDEEEKNEAGRFIQDLNANKAYIDPVVTEVTKLIAFYPAENYHKDYYETHKDAPYCNLVIAPKLEKLEKRFSELLKK